MFAYPIDDELELRQLQEENAAELFELIERNRTYLCQWLAGKYVYETLADVRRYIQTSLLRHAGDPSAPADLFRAIDVGMMSPIGNGAFDAGVWYRGRLAGVIQLHTIDWQNRFADIGYWLGLAFQGRGLMTRAVRAVLDYAFNEYRLRRVVIYCAVHNRRSRAIPERLGFKLERIWPQAERIQGRSVDDAVYDLWDYKWRGEPHPRLCRSAGAD